MGPLLRDKKEPARVAGRGIRGGNGMVTRQAAGGDRDELDRIWLQLRVSRSEWDRPVQA